MRNFIRYILFAFCFFAFSIFTKAQNYLPGIIYVKVKETHLSYFTKSAQRSTISIQQLLKVNEVNTFMPQTFMARTFKECSVYEQEVRKIYKLTFNETIDVQTKMDELIALGWFDIVEPSYIFEVNTGYQPNDPLTDSTLAYNVGTNQLKLHNFYGAWAIEKGDTNVVIGVVDTGVNFNQEDADGNLKRNYLDPIDGVNNDGDIYDGNQLTDNFRGWDVADNDNDPTMGPGSVHGAAMVSIIASTPDNNIGMIGTGFNCKYMPIKAAKNTSSNSITHGYDGLFLAALKGCKVINCSWGSTAVLPKIFENVINYVILDLDAVIISSAGNQGLSNVFYPASFPNVVSVCALAMDTSLKVNASNYNYHVDLAAAGDKLRMSDGSNTAYKTDKGTSTAAAVVSGLMGLVRSHFPAMTAMQAKQQVRVTGDYIDNRTSNIPYKGQIGKMINPVRALSDTVSPGLLSIGQIINGGNNKFDKDGEVVSFDLSLVNLLRPSNNVSYTLSAITNNFNFVQTTGGFPNMTTMDTLKSLPTLVEIDLHPSVDTSVNYIARIDYKDSKGYKDHDYIFFTMKPTEITAINSMQNDTWSIYPSVFEQYIHVEGKFKGHVSLELLDLNGKTIYHHESNNSNKIKFSTPGGISSGTYFVKVKDQDHTQISKITKK